MFAFVGYQLWGTGLEYAQAQNRLDDQFDELLAAAQGTGVPGSTMPPSTTAPGLSLSSADAALAIIKPGDAIARLEIPSIDLQATVVAGVTAEDLKKGPGHYPGTPMPGQVGNAAIAGHRTTYGQPFFRLDEIEPDEEIIVTTPQGRFVYRMTGREVKPPEAGEVLATTDSTVARLTLTTCHPRYSAAKRLVVYASLDTLASSPVQNAVVKYGLPAAPVDDGVPGGAGLNDAPDEDDGVLADALSHGWFSDDEAFAQIALWGTLLTLIVVWARRLSRRAYSGAVGVLAAAVPFLVALYFFFQNVNRLLPAAL